MMPVVTMVGRAQPSEGFPHPEGGLAYGHSDNGGDVGISEVHAGTLSRGYFQSAKYPESR